MMRFPSEGSVIWDRINLLNITRGMLTFDLVSKSAYPGFHFSVTLPEGHAHCVTSRKEQGGTDLCDFLTNRFFSECFYY